MKRSSKGKVKDVFTETTQLVSEAPIASRAFQDMAVRIYKRRFEVQVGTPFIEMPIFWLQTLTRNIYPTSLTEFSTHEIKALEKAELHTLSNSFEDHPEGFLLSLASLLFYIFDEGKLASIKRIEEGLVTRVIAPMFKEIGKAKYQNRAVFWAFICSRNLFYAERVMRFFDPKDGIRFKKYLSAQIPIRDLPFLDELDTKIALALLKDGQATDESLTESLGLSFQTVRSRRQRMGISHANLSAK